MWGVRVWGCEGVRVIVGRMRVCEGVRVWGCEGVRVPWRGQKLGRSSTACSML